MSEDARSLDPLSQTSSWAAAVRARETERPDRLFIDPWAAALAGPAGEAWIASRSPESLAPMTIRTRYFDDFLLRTTSLTGKMQLVLLASGLDSRAFRLDWPPGTCIFELDQPAVLEYKRGILTSASLHPTCEWKTIPVDLLEPWQEALLGSGFDKNCLPAG